MFNENWCGGGVLLYSFQVSKLCLMLLKFSQKFSKSEVTTLGSTGFRCGSSCM